MLILLEFHNIFRAHVWHFDKVCVDSDVRKNGEKPKRLCALCALCGRFLLHGSESKQRLPVWFYRIFLVVSNRTWQKSYQILKPLMNPNNNSTASSAKTEPSAILAGMTLRDDHFAI